MQREQHIWTNDTINDTLNDAKQLINVIHEKMLAGAKPCVPAITELIANNKKHWQTDTKAKGQEGGQQSP